ncbi:TPA: TatD family deoxyribonuclease, partial [Candidatus Bathyarchaeota archaeon]|nr:TatD family deoxyribonuclease [Candidatus Bathyarchaeota archaeon]
VAIGEIGLDSIYVMKGEMQRFQRQVFHEMLRLAEKSSLPVIIHSRGAAREIAEILTSYNLKRILFHWFSTPRELLPKLIERGYYITEGPPVLYSRRIRENVKIAPLENLLTETDGPVRFLGPFKDKITTPAFIPIVVEEIAKLKGMKPVEAAVQIYKNFLNFFDVKLV